MTFISPTHASYKLNVIPSARPIRQRVRCFQPDRHQVISAEVDNLLKAGFIREIKYPKWLANVVVVPKKGCKWTICVDYTDLNDSFPWSFSLDSSTFERYSKNKFGKLLDRVFRPPQQPLDQGESTDVFLVSWVFH